MKIPYQIKCRCREILGIEKIYVHLSGCPETQDVKEYNALPWYKKLFKYNLNKLYSWHCRDTY